MKTIFICLSLLFFLQIESRACSCQYNKYMTIDEYNQSAFIFTGKVIRIDTVEKITQKVYFLLEKLYKGNYKTDTVAVYARIPSGMCGIRFKLNARALIFTYYMNNYSNGKYSKENILYTNMCLTYSIPHKKHFKNRLKNIYNFLKQINKNQSFDFDQYYLSSMRIDSPETPDTLYATGTIKNGTAIGSWHYYNSDKLLIKEATYTSEGFQKEDISYYPNGNIDYKYVYDIYGKPESYIHFNEAGVQETSVTYDETGAIVIPKNNESNHSTGFREQMHYKPSGKPVIIQY